MSLIVLTWLSSNSAAILPLFPDGKELQDEAKITLMDLNLEEESLEREQRVTANKLQLEALEHFLTLMRNQAVAKNVCTPTLPNLFQIARSRSSPKPTEHKSSTKTHDTLLPSLPV